MMKRYDTDLYQVIHNHSIQIIPSSMAFSFALDISQGMKHIHQHEIAHRDLKSPNILLEKMENNGKMFLRAVICDFGIARIKINYYIASQKFVNVQGMSPRYTPPEVFLRARDHVTGSFEDDLMADVFPLGVHSLGNIKSAQTMGDLYKNRGDRS